jgi:hypothetical protein
MPHVQQRGISREGRNELCHAMNVPLSIYFEAILGQIKIAIHQIRYESGISLSNSSFFKTDMRKPLMHMKLSLCRSLALTALRTIGSGKENLEWAASSLIRIGRYADKSQRDILEELKWAVYYELIQRKSVWRCGCREPLSIEGQSGIWWEIHRGFRSFWDWLDEPEDPPELFNLE